VKARQQGIFCSSSKRPHVVKTERFFVATGSDHQSQQQDDGSDSRHASQERPSHALDCPMSATMTTIKANVSQRRSAISVWRPIHDRHEIP